MKAYNLKFKIIFTLFIFGAVFLLPKISFAATHYVASNGTDTWANSTNIATPCSLATANTNAVAGDTVYIRRGTYNTANISPSNSGTGSARITFANYPGETPIFTIGESAGRWAIKIQGKNYITIDGISSLNSEAFFFIGYGACYNEIKNCTFSTSTGVVSGVYDFGYITYKKSDGTAGTGSNHNWIHGNVFTKYGNVISCVDTGTVGLSDGVNDPSSNNTLENNVCSYGGHDCFDIGGRYNVVRNNIFHNEGAYFVATSHTCMNDPPSGYFGNRCLILTNYGDGVGTAQHTLVEGNRMGYAGPPPDDDGANGIEDAGFHTIIRFNYSYGNVGAGIDNKKQNIYASSVQSGSRERIYNNTLYHNGYGVMTAYGALNKSGINIGGNWDAPLDRPIDVKIKNNIIYDSYNDYSVHFLSPYTEAASPVIHIYNLVTDPSFVNLDITDKTNLVLPNLTLQVGSSAINAGTYLTQANGSGSGSVTLIVDDAYWFQDGTWGSLLSVHEADWIAIGTVGNVVQISSVNYATNTITLVSPMTWADNAPIWLYKNSQGAYVLYGSAPDIGAYEHEGAAPPDTTPPAAPTGIVVQ